MTTLLVNFAKRQFLFVLLASFVALDLIWLVLAGVKGMSGWIVWVVSSVLFALTFVTLLWCADLRDWWSTLEVAIAHDRERMRQRAKAELAAGRRHSGGIVWTRGAKMNAAILLFGIGLFAAWLFVLVNGGVAAWGLWILFGVAVILIVVAGFRMAERASQHVG